MSPKKLAPTNQGIDNLIREIRDQRVILDSDQAAIYGVATKRLNEQFQRNKKSALRSQISTQSTQAVDPEGRGTNRSQIATGSQEHRDPRLRPYAFTEHGSIMAANVLNSPRAIQMSVFVVRAFLRMRAVMGDKRELANQLAALEKDLKQRLDVHEAAIVTILQRVMDIIDPPSKPLVSHKPKIGFKP